MRKFRTKTIEEIKTQYGEGSYQWDYVGNFDSDSRKFGSTLDESECKEVDAIWDAIDHDDTDRDFDYNMWCVYAFMLEEIKTVASSKTYRVKTLDELGGTFPYFWNGEPMRYLLGKTLRGSSLAQYERGCDTIGIDSWTIQREDVTDAPLPTEAKKVAETTPTPKNTWRVMVESELIEAFGTDFRGHSRTNFVRSGGMDKLFGQKLTTSEAEQAKSASSTDISAIRKDGYGIARCIITDRPLPMAKATEPEPKKVDTKKWRYKTEDEFRSEFGSDWRNVHRFMWGHDMDYLFGNSICSSRNDDIDREIRQGHDGDIDIDDDHCVGHKHITSDLMPIQHSEPKAVEKKVAKKWRYKTERELENQYGSNWRDSQEDRWRGEMDHLFGKSIAGRYNEDIEENIDEGYSGDIDIDDEHCVNIGHITSDPMPVELPKPKRIEEIVTVEIKQQPATDWDEIHRRILSSASIPGHSHQIHTIAKEPRKDGELRINVKSKRKALRSKIFSKMTGEEQ